MGWGCRRLSREGFNLGLAGHGHAVVRGKRVFFRRPERRKTRDPRARYLYTEERLRTAPREEKHAPRAVGIHKYKSRLPRSAISLFLGYILPEPVSRLYLVCISLYLACISAICLSRALLCCNSVRQMGGEREREMGRSKRRLECRGGGLPPQAAPAPPPRADA